MAWFCRAAGPNYFTLSRRYLDDIATTNDSHGAAALQPNEKEVFTTKDAKITKFGESIIRNPRVLGGEVVFSH
jgi:hypothetical protein